MSERTFVPKWVAWEVTRRCNLRCVHCRSSADEGFSLMPFSTDDGKQLLGQLAEYGNMVVVLTGGEPLMRPDLFELAAHGTSLGLRMCLATNGLLVTPEVCDHIVETQLKMVSLSLDGATAATHDDFRKQPGAFEATLDAARQFRERGIPFLVNSSFTKRNQDEVKEVYALAKSIGAKAWYMFLIVPTGRGEELMKELIEQPQYDEMLEWHYEQEREETEILMRPTCAPHYYRIWHEKAKEDGKGHTRRSLTFSTGGGKGCIAGQSIALIDYRGDVKPCSYFEASAGNVWKTSFREVWERSDLMLAMRDFTRYEGRCGSCEYINVCGGCRARADAVHGSYLAEEPFCNYVPRKLRG